MMVPSLEKHDVCETGEWSGFSQCTKSCGSGMQKRTRAIVMASGDAGAANCGALVESRACSTQPCAIYTSCEVGDWSPFGLCTHKCGGGMQVRTRPVLVQAQPGGQFCPSLVEKRSCNSQGCVPAAAEEFTVTRAAATFAKTRFDDAVKDIQPETVGFVMHQTKAYAKALAGDGNENAEGHNDLSEAPQVAPMSEHFESVSTLENDLKKTMAMDVDPAVTLDAAEAYAEQAERARGAAGLQDVSDLGEGAGSNTSQERAAKEAAKEDDEKMEQKSAASNGKVSGLVNRLRDFLALS